MMGAIIGDIAGSRFEFHNHRSKDFELLSEDCFFTDDTVMTLSICNAFMKRKGDLPESAVYWMQKIGRKYPHCGYGGSFGRWVFSQDPQPYNSFGNGAAMRVSPVAYVADSLNEVKWMSRQITKVTHDHPEGLKGAEATAVATYLALTGESMGSIRRYITDNYYDLNFTLDGIRSTYKFNETCQDTVPQALEAFFESFDFEDAIRNAVSIGGDSDTLAAITGSVAEAFYGIPKNMKRIAMSFLDPELSRIVRKFEREYR